MRILLFTIFLLGMAGLSPAADSDSPEERGKTIVRDMLTLRPEKATTWSGKLRVKKGGKTVHMVPIQCELTPTENGWTAVYVTGRSGDQGPEKVTIIHTANKPTEYHYAKSKSAEDPVGSPQKLLGAAADVPLANSDFMLSDLGMEFLHWPRQKRVQYEIKRNTGCHVIDSEPAQVNAKGGYARVRSWVDADSLAIVSAEAYNAAGKHIKTFKPDIYLRSGMLKSVTMESRSGTETQLKLDVKQK